MEHHDASDGDEAPNPFIDEEEPLLERPQRRRRRRPYIVAAGALVVSAAALATRSRTTNLVENRLPVPLDLANCANFDDDAAMRDGCVSMDSDIFCGSHEGELGASADLFASMLSTDKASLFPILANARKVCGAACENTDEAYFMPCLWEAVARLPDVCAGTFDAAPPAASFVKSKRPKLSEPDLLSCDEHAFCMACSQSPGRCSAVLGKYGSPSGGSAAVFASSSSQTMALSALLAVGRDLPELCEGLGVAFVGAGTYAR
ncbi:unnamed protein product [Pelagomonas calceolata]|uniref:Uncharacterized protein n=2 Tax=Pelagomonas calceolata TaxID=35677 RepID=A0A8J2T2Z5_9STRA|nr:unnamed protein product [Pelagomonas calceolata]